MGVHFHVQRRGAPSGELYNVSGRSGWETHWLVGARELGLVIVPHLGDGGTYVSFPPEDIPQLIAELELLRAWFEGREYDLYLQFIDRIIRVFDETDPAEFEYGFG
ncbi:MAG: hypothetical protein JWP89_6493 [Schlesneria sp.]|nr:hypothetical protein [Schlesneria sp.]